MVPNKYLCIGYHNYSPLEQVSWKEMFPSPKVLKQRLCDDLSRMLWNKIVYFV